jgi:hypothetical protein
LPAARRRQDRLGAWAADLLAGREQDAAAPSDGAGAGQCQRSARPGLLYGSLVTICELLEDALEAQ